ncbi:MAG: hypothetical protein ACREH8_22790 [Opitutaceae bacterium]
MMVFTGGVGEHQPVLRERIRAGLEFLGVALEPTRNKEGAAIVSRDGAAVEIRIIPANEERVIANAVRSVLKLRNTGI